MTSASSPVYILGMNGGGVHNVMLKSDGTVWDWGDNSTGQLGIGDYTNSSVPMEVSLPKTIKQVAAGQYYSLALSSDGKTIYAWGDNAHGELGIGNSSINNSTTPVVVNLPLASNVSIVSIADGGNAGYALLSNGTVYAWGANEHGEAGEAPSKYGNNLYTPMQVPNLSGVTALAAGDHAALALKADGTLWAWGGNRYGQLGPNGPTPSYSASTPIPVQVTGIPPISLIATGGEDSVVVDTSGNVWSWGRNTFGELGQGIIDTSDGPHPIPAKAIGLSNIVSIDGEGPTTLVADASGNIYAFGFNRQGEVGNGTTTNIGTPTKVLTIPTSSDPLGPSVQVSAGHFFSYAYNAVTGETFAWGENGSGELGLPADNLAHPTPANITSVILGTAGSAAMSFLGASGAISASTQTAAGTAIASALLAGGDTSFATGDLVPSVAGFDGGMAAAMGLPRDGGAYAPLGDVHEQLLASIASQSDGSGGQ
jgi:alpha-tubulin suppressor-like RCC1 family protein